MSPSAMESDKKKKKKRSKRPTTPDPPTLEEEEQQTNEKAVDDKQLNIEEADEEPPSVDKSPSSKKKKKRRKVNEEAVVEEEVNAKEADEEEERSVAKKKPKVKRTTASLKEPFEDNEHVESDNCFESEPDENVAEIATKIGGTGHKLLPPSKDLLESEGGGAIASQPKNIPVLQWMRHPVNLDLIDECPLKLLPCLDPRLAVALENMGFKSLFPVQVGVWYETIGPGAFQRDICVNSPTGSGKTLAYALPIVQMLSKRIVKCLRALVVLPTRDLALQVKGVFDAIAPAVGLRVGLAVGQSSIEDEISQLTKRPTFGITSFFDPEDLHTDPQISVDILISTPGRLMDHINTTKGFSLEHLCYLVVDETDRLLREAYQSWLPTVVELAGSDAESISNHARNGSFRALRRHGNEAAFRGKPYQRLAKIILSATLTQDPSKLSQLDLHHPLMLTCGDRRYKLPENLKSYKLICETNLKPLYLVSLLQDLRGDKCIVFTSSIEKAHKLKTLLNFFGDLQFKVNEYSSLQHQSVRSKILKAFREGEIDVLVASDGMTRGMDVVGVGNVINYDMPAYIKTYIHRAGRTARAGQTGRCVTLLSLNEVKRLKKMLQKAGINSCSVYSLPADSVECLREAYSSALAKLKEYVESETKQTSTVKPTRKQYVNKERYR